jgi:hypothetical protein
MLSYLLEQFRAHRREKEINKSLSQAYNPLFACRDRIVYEIALLNDIVVCFEHFQKDLLNPANKNSEHQKIREQWQGMKFDAIIEHYKLTIIKLQDVLDNTPSSRDDSESYIIDYIGLDDDF